MTKAKPDPYAALLPLIWQLARLTHDELNDLYDMIDADLATDPRTVPHHRRKGKPPLEPHRHTLILYGGWQRTPEVETEAAREEFKTAYRAIADLPPSAQRVMMDLAAVLSAALAPLEKRRRKDEQPIARGTIESRHIWRNVYNRETQETERRPYGPYLYYRYWATGGDKNRQGKRLRNEYIGRQTLAVKFEATEPGSEERRELEARIIEARAAGTLDDLMQELGLKSTADHDSVEDLRDNQELRKSANEEDEPEE